MVITESNSLYAGGKKSYKKELKQKLKKLKFSFKKEKIRKKLKDSEYCNF